MVLVTEFDSARAGLSNRQLDVLKTPFPPFTYSPSPAFGLWSLSWAARQIKPEPGSYLAQGESVFLGG